MAVPQRRTLGFDQQHQRLTLSWWRERARRGLLSPLLFHFNCGPGHLLLTSMTSALSSCTFPLPLRGPQKVRRARILNKDTLAVRVRALFAVQPVPSVPDIKCAENLIYTVSYFPRSHVAVSRRRRGGESSRVVAVLPLGSGVCASACVCRGHVTNLEVRDARFPLDASELTHDILHYQGQMS